MPYRNLKIVNSVTKTAVPAKDPKILIVLHVGLDEWGMKKTIVSVRIISCLTQMGDAYALRLLLSPKTGIVLKGKTIFVVLMKELVI